jgi:hypothetical protein
MQCLLMCDVCGQIRVPYIITIRINLISIMVGNSMYQPPQVIKYTDVVTKEWLEMPGKIVRGDWWVDAKPLDGGP